MDKWKHLSGNSTNSPSHTVTHTHTKMRDPFATFVKYSRVPSCVSGSCNFSACLGTTANKLSVREARGGMCDRMNRSKSIERKDRSVGEKVAKITCSASRRRWARLQSLNFPKNFASVQEVASARLGSLILREGIQSTHRLRNRAPHSETLPLITEICGQLQRRSSSREDRIPGDFPEPTPSRSNDSLRFEEHKSRGS